MISIMAFMAGLYVSDKLGARKIFKYTEENWNEDAMFHIEPEWLGDGDI